MRVPPATRFRLYPFRNDGKRLYGCSATPPIRDAARPDRLRVQGSAPTDDQLSFVFSTLAAGKSIVVAFDDIYDCATFLGWLNDQADEAARALASGAAQ